VVRVVRGAAGASGTVHWDIERGEIDAAGLEGLDGVVTSPGRGSARSGWTEDQKRKVLESRTKGTQLLADALASLDASRPVLVSGAAVGVYGDRGRRAAHRGEPAPAPASSPRSSWRGSRRGAGRRPPASGSPASAPASCSTPDGGALPGWPASVAFGILGKIGSGRSG
jgi:hypothetical protein